MKIIAVAALLGLLLPSFGRALEISLEENRVSRGTVGFVDIKRVYDQFPETLKAKEVFESEVSRRDKELQGKRKALRDLRREIAELETERGFLTATPIQVSSAAPKASTSTAVSPSAPRASVAASTATAPVSVSTPIAALPGLPGLASPPPAAGHKQAVAVSTAAAPAVAASTAPVSVAASAAPASVSASSASAKAPETPALTPSQVQADVAARSAEIDKEIAEKKAKLAEAEKGLRGQAKEYEDELSKMESAQSRSLLGEIYRKVQDVAREEGVSIIIDKNAILYGNGAVDLTDRLIAALRSGGEEPK